MGGQNGKYGDKKGTGSKGLDPPQQTQDMQHSPPYHLAFLGYIEIGPTCTHWGLTKLFLEGIPPVAQLKKENNQSCIHTVNMS